ncbi:DNA-directed RNA polymerase sigma-70 factor [Streptomyces lucensis JCM 4490]|uniref:DNA-directed RNA polymerase sigma-70 factor n=1 Tax=Streptomyces lucensis JCM 4490 TaxID=1306176 RepID=A0A918MXE6_9ACTN|nr:RNA polymerase sigma factor [Streptomyces lucensis]GGW80503.1 DNA-directed RNA polymerase sigma-70 factor [Streptomyces lucensis JCM 4490]
MRTVRADAPQQGPPSPRAAPEDPWVTAAPLVRAAQAGDAMALNDLLSLLTPYVSRLCRPIALGNSADAVQEALIAVFQGLPRLKDPRALYAWVRTITVREAVRVARRTERETPVCEFADVAWPCSPELAVDVRDVLRRLSTEHRAVLVLRELEGLDERTASGILNISCGTLKSRLHRARHSFRKAWAR